MDFGTILKNLAYGAEKGIGNAIFPVQANVKNPIGGGTPSRGVLGDAIASQLYVPPPVSPLPQGMDSTQNTPQNFNNPNIVSPLPSQNGVPHNLADIVAAHNAPQASYNAPTGDVLGASTPTPTPTLAPGAGALEQAALPILNEYGISPRAGLAIAQAEGGVIGKNNPYNLGAGDTNPQGAYDFPTLDAGIRKFADIVTTMDRYKQANANKSNAEAFVQAVQNGGFAGDPATWQQRSIDTGGAGNNFKTWDEFVRHTPNWQRYSQ